ncbi:LytTR family transcriptional regulator DNA-binding domain-containing protein [Bacteroidota bacterium]
MQESLPENKFPRIHKSFIISFDKIESITGNQVKNKRKILTNWTDLS